MVIGHIVLRAIVIVGDVILSIMGWVDVETIVEDPAARVGEEVVWDEGFGVCHSQDKWINPDRYRSFACHGGAPLIREERPDLCVTLA